MGIRPASLKHGEEAKSLLKIAVVHSFYSSDSPSGENRAVLEQVALLIRAGHDVTLISRYSDEELKKGSFKVKSGLRVGLGFGPSPLEAIQKSRADVVHLHNTFPNWGISWMPDCEIPIVSTLHNYRLVCANGNLYRAGGKCTLCPSKSSVNAVKHGCYKGSSLASLPLAIQSVRDLSEHPIVRSSSRIVVPSIHAAKLMLKFGLSPHKLEVVEHFVEPHSNLGIAPAVAHETDQSRYWVYAGRLTEEKGIREMLSVWPADQNLKIVGSGPLENLIRGVELPSVSFLGLQSAQDTQRILSNSEGLIFPSLWDETFGFTYAEALGLGKTVFAYSGSAVATDIQAHGSGVVFESFDDLATLLRDHRPDESLNNAIRERYRNGFLPEVWLKKMENIYDGVVSG